MSESMRMWMEVTFNIAYLVVIWGLVIAMIRRQPQVAAAEQPMTRLFIAAFGLLALGDTGHVGFRVLAYARGDWNPLLICSEWRSGWWVSVPWPRPSP